MTVTSTLRTEQRRLVPAIVAFGVLLHLPALWLGFYADDYLHQLALRGDAPLKPWALFDFGTFADWKSVEGPGTFPWWTSLDWKARFLRPLASLSLWLDHALFGTAAVWHHVTSLGLYALLMVLVHALYRTLGLSRRLSAGALLLFACSTESALPVAWLANRNSLLAVLFTTAAVCAIGRYRQSGRAQAAALAVVCAVLAALSKESGIAAFLLVGAFALRERARSTDGSERRWAARVAMLSAALAALHVGVLLLGGYGTNSLFYSMPWSQPLAYLERLATLVAAGGLALVGPASTDILTMKPGLTLPFLVVATPITALLVAWTWRAVRREPGAGFLGLWVLFTLLPQGAAQISDRLLFGPSVGTSALLALLLADAFRADAAWKLSKRLAAGALVLSAGPLSALALPFQLTVIVDMAKDIRATALGADVGSPELGHREVFVLQAQNAFVPFTIHTTWGFERDDHDLTFRLIQAGRRGFVWTREGDRTCTFEALGERAFLDDPFEFVYRTEELDAQPGTTWDANVFTVEALAVDERGLRKIRVRFERPLDTPQYRFLVYRDGGLRAIPPPAIGESVQVVEAVSGSPFF